MYMVGWLVMGGGTGQRVWMGNMEGTEVDVPWIRMGGQFCFGFPST